MTSHLIVFGTVGIACVVLVPVITYFSVKLGVFAFLHATERYRKRHGQNQATEKERHDR